MCLELTVNQLDGWESEYRGAVSRCWNKVMEHWLDEGGVTEDYPATWEGLYTLLEDVQCTQVAEELKNALESASKASHSH